MDSVLSVILGGGRGTRLSPLTQYRSKPAVPIGGKYRLIDIPVSNCLHSGLDRIFVLTQFNSASLNRHIAQTYRFDTFSSGFVEILAAEQTMDSANWYQGTADAVRQQLRHFNDHRPSEYLILSGDHLYRMDYRAFIDTHRAFGSEMTVAVKPVTREAAPQLGILKADERGRITEFVEKPQTDAELDALKVPAPPGANPDEVYLASMGIYVFNAKLLEGSLSNSEANDFGKNIIPNVIRTNRVHAYRFEGYWEDIGTIRSFYEANLALTEDNPSFTFYQPDTPTFTHQRHLSPSRLDGCTVRRCKIGEGSHIRDTEIERAIIGIRSMIGPNVKISDTVIMGADYHETDREIAQNKRAGRLNVGIGSDCVIENAIIDKNARIGPGTVIKNEAGIQDAEGEDYTIRDGIVVVPKNAVIPPGTVI